MLSPAEHLVRDLLRSVFIVLLAGTAAILIYQFFLQCCLPR
jgi:hypothetical protein